MDVVPLTVKHYTTRSGSSPFLDWLRSLDPLVQDRIDVRVGRLRRGLFGDSRYLGGGLWELKLDFGPGYRVYLGRQASTVVLLLLGGDKSSQPSDIATASRLWADHLARKSS